MRARFLAVLVVGLFFAPATALAQEIDCDAIALIDCDSSVEVAATCAVECASQCITTPTETFQQFPDLCRICSKLSLAGAAIPGLSAALNLKCAAVGAEEIQEALCDKGPAGCCIEETESPPIPGHDICTNEKETCDSGVIHYSCCLCQQTVDGNVVEKLMTTGRSTRATCETICKTQLDPPGVPSRQNGAGSLPAPTTSQAPTAQQLQSVNALCFTAAECASADYGGSPDAFRPGFGCEKGKGRCIAPEPELKLSFPIGGVTTVKGFRNFVATFFKFLIGMIATAAAVMFVYGGFRYIFGAAFSDFKRAKEIIIDAAVGLLLSLGAITILQTVNPATLKLNKLDVFMINKQQILTSRFCADIKSQKPLNFADAGVRPAYTPVTQITSFPVLQADTECNSDYYAEGFGNSICSGRKCQSGGACVSCKSQGLCSEGADPNGFQCIKANIAGSIKYTDNRYIDNISLLYVCNKALDGDSPLAEQIPALNNNIAEVKAGKIVGDTEPTTGDQSYTFEITAEEVQDADEDCKNEGGLLGFVLGIEYNDPLGADEFAIIGGQGACGSSLFTAYGASATNPKQFPGPANHMETAIACGIGAGKNPPLQNRANYWSLERLEKATDGQGTPDPIICTFQLSDGNAISDPVADGKKVFEEEIAGIGAVRCPAL